MEKSFVERSLFNAIRYRRITRYFGDKFSFAQPVSVTRGLICRVSFNIYVSALTISCGWKFVSPIRRITFQQECTRLSFPMPRGTLLKNSFSRVASPYRCNVIYIYISSLYRSNTSGVQQRRRVSRISRDVSIFLQFFTVRGRNILFVTEHRKTPRDSFRSFAILTLRKMRGNRERVGSTSNVDISLISDLICTICSGFRFELRRNEESGLSLCSIPTGTEPWLRSGVSSLLFFELVVSTITRYYVQAVPRNVDKYFVNE